MKGFCMFLKATSLENNTKRDITLLNKTGVSNAGPGRLCYAALCHICFIRPIKVTQ